MKITDILYYEDEPLNEGIENYAIGHVNSMGQTTDLYLVDRDITLRKAFNMLSVDMFRGLIYPDNRLIIWDADEAVHDICDRYVRTKLFNEYNNSHTVCQKIILELKKNEEGQFVLGVYHYYRDIKSDELFERLKPYMKSLKNCSLVLFYDIDSNRFIKALNLS